MVGPFGAMKPSLQLRVSQQLALTPQLQQSIKLLQLSTLELEQEIERVLAENPMLERADDPASDYLRLSTNGGLEPSQAAPAPAPAAESSQTEAEAAGGSDDTPEPDYVRDEFDNMDWTGDSGRVRDDDDERDYPQLAEAHTSLREHLLAQLRLTEASERDRALVSILIEELDHLGYLTTPLADIHTNLPAELNVDLAELNTALSLLQSFDPTGVGATSLAQCLALQIRAIPDDGKFSPDVRKLANRIVSDNLPLLATRDFAKLKRKLRCDDQALKAARELIVSLDPKPGLRYDSESATYVVPDVIVKRTRNGWQAQLNPDVVPKLRLNADYAKVLKERRISSTGAMGAQLQEARWLIKNIQQRFDTILRVSQAIVDRQKAFFTHGELAMRPLILREIAETLGLHESTVSRVTTQKFILAPTGTFELKYFFGSHVATESGGAASSTAIRALIKQLIQAEDPHQPLSDSRIAELLGEQGFVVARRTVAKYREALRIAPVGQRKSL